VAYQAQLKSDRRHMHAAVGAALESLFADRLETLVGELAFHFANSDDDAQAVHYLVAAGDRARALFANREALELYEQALPRVADDAHSAALLERVGTIQARVSQYDAAVAAFRQAIERSPAADGPDVARLFRAIGTALIWKGAYAEATHAFDLGVAALHGQQDAEAASLATAIGHLHYRSANYPAAREALSGAIELSVACGAVAVTAEATRLLGTMLSTAGDLDTAMLVTRQSVVLYEQLEDLAGLADVRSNLGIIHRRRGDFAAALDAYATSIQLSERIGDQWGVATAHNNIGEVLSSRGEYHAAVDSYRRAFDTFESIGSEVEAATVLIGLGAARLGAGDGPAGRVDLLEARARFEQLGTSMFLPDLHLYLAVADLADGELDAAHGAAQLGLNLAQAAGAPQQIALNARVLAEVETARGHLEAGQQLRAESEHTFEVLGAVGPQLQIEALLRAVRRPTGSRCS
jgi:tetratricopeptide (TPR) repeat protein